MSNLEIENKSTRGQRLFDKQVRIRHLTPVSLERAKLMTASWQETEGLPIPIRRARAFEKIVNEIPIYIDDEQLLAGNYGSWPMAAEWFPESTVDWVLNKFDDLLDAEKGGVRGAEEEKKILENGCSLIGKYYVMKNEDIAVIKQIAEYWKDKSADACFTRYIGEEEARQQDAISARGAFVMLGVYIAASGGWYVPGYSKVLDKGLLRADMEELSLVRIVVVAVAQGELAAVDVDVVGHVAPLPHLAVLPELTRLHQQVFRGAGEPIGVLFKETVSKGHRSGVDHPHTCG